MMEELELSGIDLTFPLLDFRKSLKLIKLLGFVRSDITLNAGNTGKHLCTYKELSAPYENGRRLREVLEEEELKQTDLFVFIGDMIKETLNHPDKSVREKNAEFFCKAVEYAQACRCNHMTILPGIYFDNNSLTMAAEELKWRVAMAAEKGIKLSIEAHLGSVVDTPAKVRELLYLTPGLSLTLDYSHFIKGGSEQKDIDRLIPFASHMHVRNASRQSSQTIFQESEINYKSMLKKMKQYDYKGDIAIEFCFNEWENQNRVDTIGETLLLKEHLENTWKFIN